MKQKTAGTRTQRWLLLLVVSGCLLLPMGTSLAQEEPALRLSLRKDFGYSLGGSIQGTFSYRVSGPDDLARVVFLMDGESIGEDDAAPFRLQFSTGSYDLGSHTMSAVGYTSDGRTLQSNAVQRQFTSKQNSSQLEFWIIGSILLLVIGGRLISSRIANRGGRQADQPAVTGPFGGTICPKCGRPFAMHIWGLNVVAG
ncbi:MAG: Ig-like domain-containing protein, partial [Anaerolineae bacterium]